MKVPLIWLKDYININKTPAETAESFTLLGLMLDKPIENNVLDLEHRFDRADWLSIVGCARDLAAFENIPLKYPASCTTKGKTPKKEQVVDIKVECPELVRRFNTVVFRGVKVKDSPKWMKDRLEAYGIPSINNIVDITNFVMVELGQPMHAQDLAKFEKPEIVIRRAKKGESVTTLLGEKVDLDPQAFVLTQNGKPTVIGGIVGGKDTSVDKNTTDIILDAGNYDQSNIRKSSRRLKIQNETVLRYDKYLHPELTQAAIARAAYLILELAGGDYYENVDYYPNPKPLKKMEVRVERVKLISGLDIDSKRAKEILDALDYRVYETTKTKLKVEVPFFRTDIDVEDDVASDILRINNYENIPIQLLNNAPPKEITPKVYVYEDRVRDALVQLRLHEHITDPLVLHNPNDTHQVLLDNSANSEKNALRTGIYQTLLPVMESYKKHGMKDWWIFEVGKVFLKTGTGGSLKDYKEERKATAIIFSSKTSVEIMPDGTGRDLSVYSVNRKLKKMLSGFFLIMGIPNVRYEKCENCAAIFQGDLELGSLTHNSFTLDIEKLMKAKSTNMRVKDKYSPKTAVDISLIIDAGRAAGGILEVIKDHSILIEDVRVADEYIDETIGLAKKSLTVHIVFRLDEQVNIQTINKIKSELFEKLEKDYKVKVRV